MKPILPASLLVVFVAFSAMAQGPSAYRIDNFDLPNAVRIENPPLPPQIGRKGRRKLTATSNIVTSSSNQLLTQLTALTPTTSLEGFTTGNTEIDGYISESGRRNAVDPLLLYAIMHQESTFKQRAVSPKGARGLMQLMPQTARRFGVNSIFDPRQNIEGGARYMRFLLDTFDGDVPLALAGYNAGEGAVMKYGWRVPPYAETQEYVRRITRRYSLIRDPSTVRTANNFSRAQLAAARQKDPTPLSLYERSVYAVRLPDGRLQLLTQ